jgi:hypothetical protein
VHNRLSGNPRDPSFRYFADPLCIASLAIYPINRWYLKPHHIGGWFTHGYLNDVICLPLFLPMILYLQRALDIRKHDSYPTLWEVLHNWLIFSIVFEVVIPRFPGMFTHTQDPYNVVAYLLGGLVAWGIWSWRNKRSLIYA